MLAFIFNRYIEVSALVWLWLPLLWAVFFFSSTPIRFNRSANAWMYASAGASLLGFVLIRSTALDVVIAQVMHAPLSLLASAIAIFPFALFAAYQAVNKLD